MRSSKILLAGLISVASCGASALLGRAPSCHADNCARAVTGTSGGMQSSHLADCSSFFRVTVTPAPITSTSTVTPPPTTVTTVVTTNAVTDFRTVTSTYYEIVRPSGTSAAAGRRDAAAGSSAGPTTVVPSLVPSYASACSGTSRYSSACSCAGVAMSTVTAPAKVTVSVETLTPSAVYVPVAATTTVEKTVEATAVATAARTGLPCGSVLSYNSEFNCQQRVVCGKRFDGTGILGYYDVSEEDCGSYCTFHAGCAGSYYNFANSTSCVLIAGFAGNLIDDADSDALMVTRGLCD